ncbi:cytochrome P450 3A9-like [Oppia nitens]|uniref:cytochrome P450 3A9-like n=1 Tax=Oppia nitens TaxID=1686743 RepID=UPI0023DA8FBA|nr:cytochrome P450 3A9-like [Oppia nitens]
MDFDYFIKYYQSKCVYWETQGIQTVWVGLWTRLTKPSHLWELDLCRRFGKCFGIYELTQPVLYISDPVLIREVLVKAFDRFTNRRDFATGSDPMIDNSVANLKGDQWKRVRSLMSPAFTTRKLKQMIPLINQCLKTLDKNLSTVSTADCPSANETDTKRLFGAYSMEVIIQVCFGTKVDALLDEDNPIISNAKKLFSFDFNTNLLILFLFPWLAKSLKLKIFDENSSKFFCNFTFQIIEERRQQKQQQQQLKSVDNIEKRVDFLQIMLESVSETSSIQYDNDNTDEFITNKTNKNKENYRELTNDELLSQCILFFIAGYEGPATTLSIITYLLAKNPLVQEKLYKEIDNYFKKNKDVDYDKLYSLKYLDAVIMESLRLYPSSTFLERVATDDYTLSTGIQIKKGHLIHIPVYSIHHDNTIYPDADQFLPERFLANNVDQQQQQQHNPYVYLSFGAGPRNCIGMRLAQMEIKLALANAIHKYRFIDTGLTLGLR